MLTHPRLSHAIMHLRPGARPLIDFVVQDDGHGPYLVEGSMENPPSQEEVDALTDAQLDAAQRRKSGPLSVPAAQAKLALYNFGLLDKVKTAVSSYPPMQIFFESAPVWSEAHPYVMGMAAELGITDQQKAALFDAAADLG